MMNGERFYDDEAEPDLSRAMFYWWRSATKFDECVNLKMDMPNISKISPTCKILREMERLASIASEGLHELRQKLLTYRSGDMWLPIGGREKKDMDIPPVNTILLVGFHNAGKSSLVNLMYSILGRSGLVPFAQTTQISSGNSASTYASFLMEEHNVLRSTRSGFCVYDTRGFDYNHVDEALAQLSEWMTEGVRHNQLCLRQRDHLINRDVLEIHSSRSCAMYANRRVNCVMMVVNVEEIREAVKVGDKKPLEALRQLFALPASKKSNENPILILTHGDKLSTEDRIYIRLKICESIGTSESNGTYDIVCVTEYGFLPDEVDPVTAYALTEAVYRALIISDRGHLPKIKSYDWRSESKNTKANSSPSTFIKQIKSCSDCHTTRTPLWRGGPAGPKSLCNACGIKHNKKRRELLGLDRGSKNDKGKKRKKSGGGGGGNKSNEGGGGQQSLKMKLMVLGGEMMLRRSGKLLGGKLREEEQAAILLMALSYGSLYA